MERVGKRHALDVDGRPVALRDDLVSNAGWREDGSQVVEGPPEVVAHLVDVVPLVSGGRDGNVVGV